MCFVWAYSDAEDAVAKRDGYDYDGYRLRVEFPRGGTRGRSGGGGSGGRGGDGRGRGAPARRSQYRVMVSGTVTTPLDLHDDDDEQSGVMMMIPVQSAMKEKADHHHHLLPLNHHLLHNAISPSHHFFLPLVLLLSAAAAAAAERASSFSASSSSRSSYYQQIQHPSLAPPLRCRIDTLPPPKNMLYDPLSPAAATLVQLLLGVKGSDQYRSSNVNSCRHPVDPPSAGA